MGTTVVIASNKSRAIINFVAIFGYLFLEFSILNNFTNSLILVC